MTAMKKPIRVLVVDDNRDAARSLGFLLAAVGYQVETSFDGQAALAAAEQFAPDACLLDINMPGMDGYELARRLREKNPEHPPVLAAVTAYDDCDHLDRAVDAGFDLHFTKPANVLDLADQLIECAVRG
jgi:two-component system OmpR family response regulator